MRWVDVSPYSWYYRDVVDADNIKLTLDSTLDTRGLIKGIPYNQFTPGRARFVKSFVSTADQVVFPIDGYLPTEDNPILLYIDGVPTEPFITLRSGTTDKYDARLPFPIAAGIEVIAVASGNPAYQLSNNGCRVNPIMAGNGVYPTATLKHKSSYIHDIRKYRETCVALGQSLQRVSLDMYDGEDVQKVMASYVDYEQSLFTIVDGVLYTSYDLSNIPCRVTYCIQQDGVIKTVTEKVVPKSTNIVLNDRFFPQLYFNRAELLIVMQRMRINLYLRFTDRGYESKPNNERGIPDINEDRWYAEDLFDILNEKFLDGCYVFPLYEDGTFNPEGCISRAETVTYIHRFMRWCLERFR